MTRCWVMCGWLLAACVVAAGFVLVLTYLARGVG